MVRVSLSWCRRSEGQIGLNLQLVNSLRQLHSKLVPVSNGRKDKAVKGEDGLGISYAVPKIHWASNPLFLYSHKAMGSIKAFHLYNSAPDKKG